MQSNARFGSMRWVSLTLLVIVHISCGGGGGGSDETPFPGFTPVSESTPMTVDDYSAATAVGMVHFAHSLGNIVGPSGYTPLGRQAVSPESRARVSILRAVRDQIDAHFRDHGYQAAASGSIQEACPYGGSYRASFEWDGPDTAASECDMLNLHGTMIMSDCQLDSESIMDGAVSVQYSGYACDPTAMFITMENFSLSAYDTQVLSRYLEISASGLTWSGDTIYSGTTVINGQAIGLEGGYEVAAAFYDYTEVAETVTDEYDNYYLSLDIFGGITGPCVDGWAYVETLEPILLGDYAICPVSGHLVVSGDYAMDVLYYSDGSVDVGSQAYATCEDLEIPCPLP